MGLPDTIMGKGKAMSREVALIELCLETPSTLAPVIIGPPGIGKTQRVRAIAKKFGWQEYYFTPGTHGEGFCGVVPFPDEDGLKFPAPKILMNLFPKDCKGGLFFIDEINTCPPALQPALLGLLLEGRIGDYVLPPQVRRIAAMNPVTQAASGWELPAALANRLQYYKWEAPSASDWVDWLLTDCEIPGPDGIKAKALAAAYHKKCPGQLLEDPDKVLSGRDIPAFATPRSWESAIRMLAKCTEKGRMDDYPAIAEGHLGKPIAVAWATWLRQNDLPDPEDLLKNPEIWKPNAAESDKIFATCYAIAEAAISGDYSKKDKRDRWFQAWKVLNRAIPFGKGMVAIAARRLARPEFRPEGALLNKDVKDIIATLKDVIAGAGLM